MAPTAGLEPATSSLTERHSTIELYRNVTKIGYFLLHSLSGFLVIFPDIFVKLVFICGLEPQFLP